MPGRTILPLIHSNPILLMAINDELLTVLSNLRAAVPELKGALVASADGLAIAHSLQQGADSARMAAMVATALGLGKRICDTFGGGALGETSISGDSAQVFIYSAGGRGVLAVIASAGANIGLIHLEARDAAKAIAQILG
jgi:predicted regulator of Ras-like GTPase activity (Roadblock/LC7/MglB family)